MERRWKILTADKQKADELKQSLKISSVICNILVQRGIETFEQSKYFFRPELKDLHDPWLMKDMDKAVERIIRAVNNNEKILVFGDYDVDGTTAVACMYRFLKKHIKTGKHLNGKPVSRFISKPDCFMQVTQIMN